MQEESALDSQNQLYETIEEHHQFSDLSDEERQDLLAYVASLQDIERSRADVEQAKGWRTVFENAPPETIPFIIYSVYVSAYAIGAIVAVS